MPLLPANVAIAIDTNGMIVGYRYKLPYKEVKLDPLDVVHFKLPSRVIRRRLLHVSCREGEWEFGRRCCRRRP